MSTLPAPSPIPPAHLAELASTLDRESDVVRELCQALVRQREAVARSDVDAVNASVDAIGRVLLTLDQSRRRRVGLVAAMTGDRTEALEGLEARLGPAWPAALSEARARLREAAAEVTREVRINRAVLRRAVETGEAFLQALFSASAGPPPCYRPNEGADEKASGLLLNRRA